MKKTLVALAVLGSIATGAQAQVTLYGIADVWVGRTSATTHAGVKTNENVMESGGLSGSRLGFMGSKELGNGLTGVFKLEQGFRLDTGKTPNAGGDDNDEPVADDVTFNRQAYVGLAGGFGQVTFGNTWTAMDDVLGAANSGFDSALSASNNVLAVQELYESNPGNTIKYTSPSFGGFSMGASHAMKEADNIKVSDVSLSYAAGDLAANLAYQQHKTVGEESYKLTALNASYNLGIVKLLGSLGVTKLGDAKATDVQFGVDVPVTAQLTVSAGYAQSKDNSAAGDGKRKGFGIAAGYALAETTTLYGGYRQSKASSDDASFDDVTKKDSVFAVGIKHAF